MGLKKALKKIAYGYRADSNTYIEHLSKIGVSVGRGCTFFSPMKSFVDEQYPWMIEIGDYVQISQGVIILTHDYSWSVLKTTADKEENDSTGAVLGAAGTVKIGNDVFIGMNAMILRNVTIGDHVVIGAGSVVTKDCPSNGVYVGSPARRIMGIDEYFTKRKQAQKREAVNLAVEYYKHFHEWPGEDTFYEFFMLFCTKAESMPQRSRRQLALMGNEQASIRYMEHHQTEFSGYSDFINYCKECITGEKQKK